MYGLNNDSYYLYLLVRVKLSSIFILYSYVVTYTLVATNFIR